MRGDIPLWSYHRERLAQGGCGAELLDVITRAVLRAARSHAGERTARLRAHLEVFPDAEYGIQIERRLSSLDVVRGPRLVLVRASELPPEGPLGVGLPPLPPAAAKPADRSWWDAAAALARTRGGHQACIVSDDELVIDGSSATVWIVAGDEVATVPAPPAVAGVARRFVLAELAGAGVRVRARPIHASEIERADEVFLTNAFGGAVAVRGRGGRITEMARGFFRTLWNAEA